ncbi:MAG: DUF4340 domain-containing protein [SAR202 cluster bacterium]|nr:DUF4340 domain-containing protein [SAR202 cluster bacterium]
MNVRLTLLLVVLLVVIGGLVAITQVLRGGDTPDRGSRLYRLSSSELNRVVVTRGEETITFLRKGDEWFIDDTERGMVGVDVQRWGGIPVLLGGPTTTKLIEPPEGQTIDFTSYGVAPPKTSIHVATSRNQAVDVHIGDATPDATGYYVKVHGTNVLYVVNSAWVDVINRLINEPPYPPVPA